MPQKDEHLTQAVHNEAFVNSFDFDTSLFLDWVLTGIFYSSIHYIEAFLATKDKHTSAHKSRDNYVGVYLVNIYDDYRDLKDDTDDARYRCRTISKEIVEESLGKLENIKICLRTTSPPIL